MGDGAIREDALQLLAPRDTGDPGSLDGDDISHLLPKMRRYPTMKRTSHRSYETRSSYASF